jgi:hypothetical protein
VPQVDCDEVCIEGEVKTLFETSGSVQLAGLIGDWNAD